MKSFTLCDASVAAGEIAYFALPMPERYSCAPMYMPIKVIHGKKQGPCFTILSTFKGSEYNGIEIVNRLMTLIDPEKLSGTLLAVPVVNTYALTHYPRTLPVRQSLYNCFPGDEKGTYGDRVAKMITQEILGRSDYCVQLDTGDMHNNILPQVFCDFEKTVDKKLAQSFQTAVINNVHDNTNSLRKTAAEMQIPFVVFQAGEAMRFDETAISFGVEGALNALRHLKMIDEQAKHDISPIVSQDLEWLTAERSGIMHTTVNLGQSIKKGEVIGDITDPFGAGESHKIIADNDGIVVGINTAPLISEGMITFRIAQFLNQMKAEALIEEWNQKQPDSYINTNS